MNQKFDAEFYKKILNQTNSNIYITDIETDEIVYMNDYMKQTFRLEDVEGKICWQVLQSGMKERCDFCKVRQLKEKEDGSTCVWREKNTVTGRVYMNHDSLEQWEGRWYHIQNSVDITDRLQLSMEASIDELTGVLNRNAGKKLLEDLLKGMKKSDKFTVALYDINGLKWVNDTYGHLEGDRLLVFVAQNIQKELDESDFVFRLSGDEFIVVFVDKDLEEAETWMKHMLELLEVRRAISRITYDVTFSYGLACIYEGENLSVSDVLSIADTQMYIQKRDHHILMGKRRLQRERIRKEDLPPFQYNKDYLFEALSEGIDDYVFVGNLKTGEFMYSYKMVMDFDLPGQVVSNAAAFWGEKVHPDDAMMFLRSNQEIADGRVERHTIAYRAQNAAGEWVHLLCKGKMIRDQHGKPDLFAGVIRNLDRARENNEKAFQLSEKGVIGEDKVEQFIASELRRGYLEKPEDRADGENENGVKGSWQFLSLEERLHRLEQMFAVATEHTRLNMWEYDLVNHRIIQTDSSMEVHGMDEVIEQVPQYLIEQDYIHPDSIAVFEEMYRKLERGEDASGVIRVRCKDRPEEYWWEKVAYTLVPNGSGRPVWAIGLSEDVTAQKEAEIRVFKEQYMKELLSDELVFSFRLNMTTDELEEVWAYARETSLEHLKGIRYETIYESLSESIANEDDRKRFRAYYSPEKVREYVQDGMVIPEFEFRQKQKDGRILWVSLSLKSVSAPESADKILFGYARNIDLQKKRELSLQKKAEIDEISGFYNYGTLKLLIQNTLKNEQGHHGVNALMMLDADNFKEANYEGNFLIGDEVLRQMAAEIRKHLPPSCITGRQGGDIFMIFFHNMQSEQEIHDLADSVRKSLCRTYRVENHEVELSVSAGIVYQFTDHMPYEQFYQCALHALDAVKRNGKNQMLSYQEIEHLGEGLEIELFLDLSTYQIKEINGVGEVALGMNQQKDPGIKCYELLHSRKEPCPFCVKELRAGKTRVWECFVSRLNKLMYIQEQTEVRDGIEGRRICLKETPFEQSAEFSDLNFYNLLEECTTSIEKGNDRHTVYMPILDYIGKFYGAHRGMLFFREESVEMNLTVTWKVAGIEEEHMRVLGSMKLIEEALESIYPNTVMVIKTEQSPGYEKICQYYGKEHTPGPLIVSGIYENEHLTGCIILEKVHRNAELQKPLEMASGFLRRLQNLSNLQSRYQYMLCHDQTTGVMNYEAYIGYLERVNEDVLSTFGMAGLQIVDLKKYNQKYGVARGTDLLVFAGSVLSDIFGREFCYRVSGANFLAICPDISYENFAKRCVMLENRMEAAYPGRSASVGAWEYSSISVAKMQQQIEEKMQLAVNKKRNQNYAADEHTLSDLLKGLEDSIDQGSFRAYLQPKADAKTGKICGAEALVRYYQEGLGIVPPAKFLPAIEKAGMIRHVDLFVLKDVCRIIRMWIDQGWEPFTISLNYSRATILEPGILEETDRIVEEWGVPKHLLEIEVTESIGSIDSAGLKHIVNEFVEAGYKIALDDFGAEYSNIYVLYSLNISSLKLDRRIVSDIYHDGRARMVVENVIDICQKLGISCVAEGVETKEHLEILRDMSCDKIQGYYLNKPLPEEDFGKLYILS